MAKKGKRKRKYKTDKKYRKCDKNSGTPIKSP